GGRAVPGMLGMLGLGVAQAATPAEVPPPAPAAPLAAPVQVAAPDPEAAEPMHLALAPQEEPAPPSYAPQDGEVPQTLALRRTARLLAEPDSGAAVVAELRTGMLLFPTGTNQGAMI